ncbi:hypothetical protein [Bacillus pseudomycoides]|uniref:hypothetical protein n=1 Tax=Bacillus pseudomycoides TaxID=64104 RepID=UPI000BF018B1|nr:hypothetical protein [Bacillus pseudomycoides]PEK60774.1 hypothetical protein CN593_27840 [Bacillus pseudomycoides]PFY53600.1 hypothetical protein COL49_25935 [Bacillus pseudomycoides]PGE20455.1 hypothetical protein COM57_29500 [Bacillus pseudomycoides]
MSKQELTPLQKIMVGYDELKKEATKDEDKAATMAAEQAKVAEGVAMKQTGKTFYEMFNEGNPFNKGVAPYMLVKAGYDINNRPEDAGTTE